MAKVLLAEDDQNMLFLLKTLLSLEGFTVATVDVHSEDIVARARAEKPDAVLMDVHLVNKNGVEVLKEMRQDEELKNAFVVMASGMDLRERCLAAGANIFLLKPYMPDDLISALKQGVNK
jgi:CheY-like chemotaxis protein